MAKLTRQAQQIFAGQAPSDMIAAFGTTQTGTPIYSTDLSTLQTTNYQQGWQDAIIADKAPFLEEMNGVQYGLSYQIAYAQQMGIPEWLSTQDYYKGSRCIASDYNVYKSLTDDNTGNNPVVDDGTNWVIDFPEEANVLNYITNCITSAPNGVPSYSGTTVTVQEGTNYLFPNGRNSNNGIQNINFALASAATGTITGSTAGTYCVFVTSELELIFTNNLNYFISNTQPTALNDTTTAGVWFNPQTNLMYQCAATAGTPSWSTFEGAICATLSYDGSTITGFNPIYPIELSNKLNITLDNATQTTKETIVDYNGIDYNMGIKIEASQLFIPEKDGVIVSFAGASNVTTGVEIYRGNNTKWEYQIGRAISRNSSATFGSSETRVTKGKEYNIVMHNPSKAICKFYPCNGVKE